MRDILLTMLSTLVCIIIFINLYITISLAKKANKQTAIAVILSSLNVAADICILMFLWF